VALATGHEDPTKAESSLDWTALARAPVAVFLMGIERLATISDKLQAEGKPADTPAAVVSSATSPQQRIVKAPLEKIADAVATADIRPPAILVVGGTVPLADHLDWFSRRPMAGKRVFVTRTRAQAGRLSALLREAGAEALEFPAIKIEFLSDEEYVPLDGELNSLSTYTWVAFPSTNAVDAVWRRLADAGRDARAFAGARIAAVGPATAEALRDRGITADLVPYQFTSDALVAALGSPDPDARILLPRAADAPEDLPATLRERGWECVSPAAYRTVVDDSSVAEGRTALDTGVDAILFTAGSTVRSFVDLWGLPPAGCVVCCMGPRTAAVAGELGVSVDAVAEEQTLEGLVAAAVAAVGR
jgi:uroporphyrinogen III methyltransferase/synthase